MTRVLALALALAVASCVQIADEYRCEPGRDCNLDGEAGRCESTGHCSVPDTSCGPAGSRYHASAGQQAGICVLPPGPMLETAVFDLKASSDTVHSSCASDGARDLSIELTLMAQQTITIDTVGPEPRAGVVLSLRDGACPAGLAEITGCRRSMCADASYNVLAANLPPGPYCLVVEEADPAAENGTFALRILEGGREAMVIDRPMQSPPQSTCPPAPSDPRPPSCAPTSNDFGTGAVVFTTCPGTRVRATVTPNVTDGIDVALSLRNGGPIGDELVPCTNVATGTGAEMIDTVLMGPAWLIVDRVTGPSCSQFSISHILGP